MRCKNCKKKIENPNLIRCPHCGKQLPKKKEYDWHKLSLTIAFSAVSVVYLVTCFITFFYDCLYYSKGAMIIQLIVFMVALPFVFGNDKHISRPLMAGGSIALSLAFIANYISAFSTNYFEVMKDGLCEPYFFGCMGLIFVSIIIQLLNAVKIIKKEFAFSFVSLGLAVAGAALTVAYFAITGVVRPYAVFVLVLQAFIPSFMGFHVFMKEHMNSK